MNRRQLLKGLGAAALIAPAVVFSNKPREIILSAEQFEDAYWSSWYPKAYKVELVGNSDHYKITVLEHEDLYGPYDIGDNRIMFGPSVQDKVNALMPRVFGESTDGGLFHRRLFSA